jgi:hypothetical protein
MRLPSFGHLATIAAVLIPFALGELNCRNPLVVEIVPDNYIVVFKDDVTTTQIEGHQANVVSYVKRRSFENRRQTAAEVFELHKHNVGAQYDLNGFKGYHVVADSDTIRTIAASPEVRTVERQGREFITNLSRLHLLKRMRSCVFRH